MYQLYDLDGSCDMYSIPASAVIRLQSRISDPEYSPADHSFAIIYVAL